jgi:hypothetical protein
MKGKKIFNKNEANQIIQLLKKKIESGNEKKYRDQLRRIGFYISDFGYSRDGFSPDDFEALIASGKIQIIDRETNNKFNKEIKKQESSTIHKISGFPPIVSENSKLLILGTMPSDELPAVSCKRKDMLNLSLLNYKKYRDLIVQSFIKASKILSEHHIFTARDLPYNTQLIPMSAILAVLGDKIDNLGYKKKLMQWFWCGVFGELYGSANETRYALDLPQVVNWIENNGDEPKTIYDANFSPSRLHTLRTRNSAAYKGVYALLMDDQTKDWISATKIDFSTYFSESIDIHHIFPVAWCEKNGISKSDYNCIINKTPLSGRTNRIVSGEAPSKYLARIQKHAGIKDDEFQEILKSHVLSPEFLYTDDFRSFFNDRKERVLQKIEEAINKHIPRGEIEVEEGVFIDTEPDEEIA